MTVSDSLYPRPGIKDWALLVINIVFVALSFFILPHERDVGIVTLAFFGPCLIVTIGTVLRKFRFRRFRALKAEIVGGVPIRASRAQALAAALMLLLMGTIIVLCGLVPNDYVRFDPEGITFSRARYSYTVPWDSIAQVRAGQMHNNPALFIWLHGYDRVTVQPREKRDRVLKSFAWGTGWAGAPIMLLPSRYGIDLPMLMLALERYLTEPNARSELAHRLLPPA